MRVEKTCHGCGKRYSGYSGRTGAACRDCNGRLSARNWYAKNKDRVAVYNQERSFQRREAKRRSIAKGYGLTLDQYDALRESQGGLCAVCRAPPGKKSLAIDHCHTTGEVRALLCGACNTSLGLMKESPDLIRKLADYLEAYQR